MILCNWYLDTDRVIKGRLLLIKNVHALNFFPHDQSVLARLEALPPLLLLSFLENVTCILDDSHPLLGKARLFLFAMLLGLRLVVIDRTFSRCVVIGPLLVLLWLRYFWP